MTKRLARTITSPARTVSSPTNVAAARMTVTPSPSKRAWLSWGAIESITSCTPALTAQKSTSGDGPRSPSSGQRSASAAAWAEASRAFEGTQP